MNKYKTYFDSISPLTSDEEFAQKVTASAKKSKRNRRMVISSLTAAAAVMVLTVTVSAAYNWDIAAAVRSFFGDKGNLTEETIIDVNVTNVENTFDNLDISVKGAVRDENFTVIFLDVTRTDNGILDCAPYHVQDAESNDIIMSNGEEEIEVPIYSFDSKIFEAAYVDGNGEYAGTAETMQYRQSVVKDDNDMDGHITQALCIDTRDPFFEKTDRGLLCDKIKLRLGGFHGKKCSGRYSADGKYITLISHPLLSMDGSFSCEIDLGNCNTQKRSIKNAGCVSMKTYSHTSDPADMEFRNFEFSVKSIDITPVSVSIQMEGDVPEETYYVETTDFGSILLNDGKEIGFGDYNLPMLVKESGNIRHIPAGYTEDKWTFSAGFILPETVDIEDVRAIKIGNAEFTLD